MRISVGLDSNQMHVGAKLTIVPGSSLQDEYPLSLQFSSTARCLGKNGEGSR
jgi:hypothetical protein